MKKLIIVATVLFSSIGVMAQEGIHVGVKGGPQFSMIFNQNLSDAQEIDYINTWESAYGLSTNYHFSETMGVGIDVMFSSISQKYEFYESAPTEYSAILETKYTRIPLLLHFNSDPGSAVMFKGFFGPQLGLLGSANWTNTYVSGTGAEGKDPKTIVDGDTGDEWVVNDPARIAASGPGTKNYDIDNPNTYPGVVGSGDVKTHMEGMTIGVAVGLGFAINFTDYLNLGVGINLGYDFADTGAQNIWTPTDLARSESDFLGGDANPGLSPSNNITGGIEVGITYVIAN